MSESDTPRTDAVQQDMEQSGNDIHYRHHQYLDLARQLERELAQSQARVAELEKDAARLDWLHAELKLTIAHALHWPYTPQDPVAFRGAVDRSRA